MLSSHRIVTVELSGTSWLLKSSVNLAGRAGKDQGVTENVTLEDPVHRTHSHKELETPQKTGKQRYREGGWEETLQEEQKGSGMDLNMRICLQQAE